MVVGIGPPCDGSKQGVLIVHVVGEWQGASSSSCSSSSSLKLVCQRDIIDSMLIGLLCTGTLLPYVALGAGLMGAGAEWLLWGAAVVALIQRTRLSLDRAFEQDTRFGLSHAPATVMLIGLLLHSAVRSTRGTATWKGRTLPKGGAL